MSGWQHGLRNAGRESEVRAVRVCRGAVGAGHPGGYPALSRKPRSVLPSVRALGKPACETVKEHPESLLSLLRSREAGRAQRKLMRGGLCSLFWAGAGARVIDVGTLGDDGLQTA